MGILLYATKLPQTQRGGGEKHQGAVFTAVSHAKLVARQSFQQQRPAAARSRLAVLELKCRSELNDEHRTNGAKKANTGQINITQCKAKKKHAAGGGGQATKEAYDLGADVGECTAAPPSAAAGDDCSTSATAAAASASTSPSSLMPSGFVMRG